MSNIDGVRDNGGRYAATHDKTQHKLYPVWRAMTQRCFNPRNKAYKNYGGRGIGVCLEWAQSPVTFIEWLEANNYGPGLQIDRIDNDGDYSPANCRLATPSENARNRRSTRYVTLNGAKRLFIDIVEEFEIKYATLYKRIFISGMTPEAAVAFRRKA
jgi:hypothetical protein